MTTAAIGTDRVPRLPLPSPLRRQAPISRSAHPAGRAGDRLLPARGRRNLGRYLVLLLLTFLVAGRPALAQDDDAQVLRDTETEAFFKDISTPLAKAAGLDTSKVQVILLADQSINAGATSGQLVGINAGTIFAADNVLELQGVIAHEFGHLAGGHVPL